MNKYLKLLFIFTICLYSLKLNSAILAVPEFGFKKTAMGASIAKPDDLSAVYHNPAGIGLLKDNYFFFSFGAAFPVTSIKIRPWPKSKRFISEKEGSDGFYDEVKPNKTSAYFPMLGLSSHLNEKWTAALSAYVPNAVGASFDEKSLVRYHMIEGYFVAGSLTGTLAYKISPKLIVGLGLNALYVEALYRRKFYPVVKDKNGKDAQIDFLIGKNSEIILEGAGIIPGFSLGLILMPNPSLNIGFSMIAEVDFISNGDVTFKPDGTGSEKEERKGEVENNMLIPLTLHTGISYSISKTLEWGLDFRYYQMSRYKQQKIKLKGLKLDSITRLGYSIEEFTIPKNYRNNGRISTGLKYKLDEDLEIAAGGHIYNTHAPDETVSLDAPSFNHFGLRTGIRYGFEHYRFALSYVFYHYMERNVTTSITSPPSNFKGSGNNHVFSIFFEANLGDESF